jgi:hypothetical protein
MTEMEMLVECDPEDYCAITRLIMVAYQKVLLRRELAEYEKKANTTDKEA